MEDLCTGCLCTGRNMRNLFDTEFVHIYSQILNEISEQVYSGLPVRLCWGCEAALRAFQRFRARAQASYLLLRDCAPLDIGKRGLPRPPALQIHRPPPLSIPPCGDSPSVDPISYSSTDPVSNDPVSNDPRTGRDDPIKIEAAPVKRESGPGADCLADDVEVKEESESIEHLEPETFVNDLVVDSDSCGGDGSELALQEEGPGKKVKKKVKKKSKIKNKVKNKKQTTTKPKDKPPSLKSRGSNEISENISLDDDSEQTKTEDVQSRAEQTETAIVAASDKGVARKRSREVLPERPTCVECGKEFSSRKTYRYHLNVLHRGNNRHPCNRCGKVFQWKSNLGRHMRSHRAADSDELHCALCDKRFASIATYRQHLKISRRHVSEKDFGYQCDKCHKKFVSKTRLTNHIDWDHLQQVKFRCALCGKPFKCHTSLYVHTTNVHRDPSRRDNLCHVCGKSYQNPAKLKYHIVAMHTSQTPYQCQKCDAAFGWYSSLYRHVREVHYKMKVQPKKSRRGKKEVPVPPEPRAGGDGKALHLTLPQLLSQSIRMPQ